MSGPSPPGHCHCVALDMSFPGQRHLLQCHPPASDRGKGTIAYTQEDSSSKIVRTEMIGWLAGWFVLLLFLRLLSSSGGPSRRITK